ncbi:alpha/beta-hydrolase [Gonapodya prolifera JEL478]|uniref:Alpha/beta-hydrolase n=1 Tax=Gonapodya prolifera (strain JEL478) TaxID=1344416 RepID=A0A139AXW8_GONPJ|nr:alpha/beta-hydrolase [Gonapodya prolifera JEL478]|eukprot:KXS21413.1 alpha/beta-hydrolase [Gonapodya prolifera JEL478]
MGGGVGKEGYIIPPEYPTSNPAAPLWSAPASNDDATGAIRELRGEWVEILKEEERSWGGYVREWVFGSKEGRSWDEDEKVVLYLHGGAYTMLSPATHRSLTVSIARATNTRIFVPDYRLAPEDPFPAALHDAFAAWLYLTRPDHPALGGRRWAKRFKPENVTIMGDSAGGGLTMALMVYLKEFVGKGYGEGFGMPGGAVLLSPWVDLTCSHPSYHANSALDYLPAVHTMDLFGPMYRSDNSPNPVAAYLWGWNGRKGLERRFCSREDWAWERLSRPVPGNGEDAKSGRMSDDHDAVDVEPEPEAEVAGAERILGSAGPKGGAILRRANSAPPSTAAAAARAAVAARAAGGRSGSGSGPMLKLERRNTLLGKPVSSLGEEYVKTLVQVRHPCVSPLFADLRGLPPVLIQAGDCELLRDESIALARKYSHANQRRPSLEGKEPALHENVHGHVRHELYTDMVHVFQAFPFTKASKIAIANIGRFHRNLYSAKGEAPQEQVPFDEDEALLRVNSMGDGGDVLVTFRNVDGSEQVMGSDGSDYDEDDSDYGEEESDDAINGGEDRMVLDQDDGEVYIADRRGMFSWFGGASANAKGSTGPKSILKNGYGSVPSAGPSKYHENLMAAAVSTESDAWLRGYDENVVDESRAEPLDAQSGAGSPGDVGSKEWEWSGAGSSSHPLTMWGVW